VTLSRDAWARAVRVPACKEALGLPRPWDQQWSLRIQQVLAYETDLLEYDDIFEGSVVIEAKVAELCASARAEIDRCSSSAARSPRLRRATSQGAEPARRRSGHGDHDGGRRRGADRGAGDRRRL